MESLWFRESLISMEGIKMKKTAILGMLFGLITYTQLIAQDFYNGCRGPKSSQIDLYATYQDGNTNGKMIPKLFIKNLNGSLPDLLVAAPFSVNEKGIENLGINLGYISKFKDGSLIGAVGVFKDNNGKYNVINHQVYSTLINGPVTLDLEGNLPMNVGNQDIKSSASATLGYGINDWVRLGGSATMSKGKEPDYKALVRLELARDHTAWIEGFIGEDITARLAINL